MPLTELLQPPERRTFRRDVESRAREVSDIVIIGGGIIGCSIGYELAREGLSVTILERNSQPGREASSGAFGTLSPRAYHKIPESHYDLIMRSVDMYPNWIQELAETSGLPIKLENKMRVQVALSEEDMEEIRELYTAANAHPQYNIHAELLTKQQIHELEPNIAPNIENGMLLSRDDQINNMVLLTQAVVKAATTNGCRIITNTPVTKILSRDNRIVGVRSNNKNFYGGKIIVCAGSWSGDIPGVPSLPIVPQRGQGVMVDNPGLVDNIIVSPHGYIAPRRDGKIILGIIEEQVGFNSQPTAGGIQQILTATIDMVPSIRYSPIMRVWAGLRPTTSDGLPVLGSPSGMENLMYATGHHYGMMLAPITAKIVRELVTSGDETQKDNLQAFSPDRFYR